MKTARTRKTTVAIATSKLGSFKWAGLLRNQAILGLLVVGSVLVGCRNQLPNFALEPAPLSGDGGGSVFFDDFSYQSNTDPYLRSMGWILVDGISGPPASAYYSRDNVTFRDDTADPSNRVAVLQATTQNTLGSMRLSRIETPIRFLEGTYAARVFFDNGPRTYRDGSVQAFYLINNTPARDPSYSEADFEYLPYDVWDPSTFAPGMWMTTWEMWARSGRNTRCLSDDRRTACKQQADYAGWHTLVIQLNRAVRAVDYYIDGVLQATAGGDFYPESSMNISFINWITNDSVSPGSSTSSRTYTVMADWVLHVKDQILTPAEVVGLVGDYRSVGIARQDTVNGQPQPASGLGAVATGSGQVELQWQDNSLDESGFKIERRTSTSGSWMQIAVVGADVTSYQDAGQLGYYYRVRAYNVQGDSTYSNEAQVAEPGTTPLPPANLTVTAVSSSQTNLSWQDNSTDEKGFKIERRLGLDGTWAQIAGVGANITTYQDSGLEAGSNYSYRVRAYNAQGDSGYSNEAQATTPAPSTSTVPLVPSSLDAVGVSSSQINLSWQDNSTNETGFKIERKRGPTGIWSQIATVGVNVTRYQSTDLVSGTRYYYRVRAYNAQGNSTYSNEATARTEK
ncbi:MAG: fibronectin type III domain-containing protein [Deinococcus sp.]|nr:fibronectin type III domain-containing protein [Deinococcus sp.]